jgi:hypothetical protein
MRKVFSSHEVGETSLVRDALVPNGIAAAILNEHSGRSAVPAFRPPAEVWIEDDSDYENARRIVGETLATLDRADTAPPWICSNCREENPQSFDACWSCGREKNGRD